MVDLMLAPISHRKDQDADWGLGWGIRSRNREGDQRKFVYHSGFQRKPAFAAIANSSLIEVKESSS